MMTRFCSKVGDPFLWSSLPRRLPSAPNFMKISSSKNNKREAKIPLIPTSTALRTFLAKSLFGFSKTIKVSTCSVQEKTQLLNSSISYLLTLWKREVPPFKSLVNLTKVSVSRLTPLEKPAFFVSLQAICSLFSFPCSNLCKALLVWKESTKSISKPSFLNTSPRSSKTTPNWMPGEPRFQELLVLKSLLTKTQCGNCCKTGQLVLRPVEAVFLPVN